MSQTDDSRSREAFGQICWLEIPVLSVPRAKTFYTTLFAWTFAPDPVPAVGDCVKSMHFFSKGKTLNGAFLEVDEKFHVVNNKEGLPAALPVLPSFCVMDCQETLDEGEKLGGKTGLPKTEIGNGMGYFARLIDTEGNMVGLWSQK